MGIWFDSILKEKDEVSQAQINLVEPKTEVQRGDHVFAIATNELCRIYYMIYQRQKRAVEMEEVPISNQRESRQRVLDRICLDSEIDALETAFWTSVFILFKDSLSTQQARYLVRKGWKLIWINTEAETLQNSTSQIMLSGSKRIH